MEIMGGGKGGRPKKVKLQLLKVVKALIRVCVCGVGGGGGVLYTCTYIFNFTVFFLPFTSIQIPLFMLRVYT